MKFTRWISALSRLGPPFWIALAGALLLVLTTILYPFQSTTVPQWNLRVVDNSGAAVPGIYVTEHWQHYPIDDIPHEEILITNGEGQVNFDRRSFRASLTRRLLARVRVATEGGRKEPYASVVVWGSKLHQLAVAVYSGVETPQPEVRVQRVR